MIDIASRRAAVLNGGAKRSRVGESVGCGIAAEACKRRCPRPSLISIGRQEAPLAFRSAVRWGGGPDIYGRQPSDRMGPIPKGALEPGAWARAARRGLHELRALRRTVERGLSVANSRGSGMGESLAEMEQLLQLCEQELLLVLGRWESTRR